MKTFFYIFVLSCLVSSPLYAGGRAFCSIENIVLDDPKATPVVVSAPLVKINKSVGFYYRSVLNTPKVSAWFETSNPTEPGTNEVWSLVNYEITTTDPVATTGGLFYLRGDAKFSSTHPYFKLRDSKGRLNGYFLMCVIE